MQSSTLQSHIEHEVIFDKPVLDLENLLPQTPPCQALSECARAANTAERLAGDDVLPSVTQPCRAKADVGKVSWDFLKINLLFHSQNLRCELAT